MQSISNLGDGFFCPGLESLCSVVTGDVSLAEIVDCQFGGQIEVGVDLCYYRGQNFSVRHEQEHLSTNHFNNSEKLVNLEVQVF